MSVRGDELVAFLYSDLSGLNRGRAVPADQLEGRLRNGVGWVPANQALTPFDVIAPVNPWGSLGDLRLVPDPETRVRVDLWPDVSPLHLLLCDAVEPDGTPWDACPRTLLRRVVAELEHETGLTLLASFEHEFFLSGTAADPPPVFSFEALRLIEPFAGQLTAAFRLAGRPLETFVPEYGRGQFEISLPPAEGLAAADDAAIARELVREVARRVGRRASFAPLATPAGAGNGLHVHLSFRDEAGRPAAYDAQRPGGVSERMGQFVAGILRHLPALCAVAAPSAISYLRLVPHRWSAGHACFAERNREAALRVTPVIELPGSGNPADSFNVEFRPADGASCPHLVLALLVRAGLQGIRERLPVPPLVEGDPAELGPADRERLGIAELPRSLAEALNVLERDEVVGSYLSPALRTGYLALKRMEIELLAGLDDEAVCDRYLRVY
ncbi:MAG: glutamine synthetase family protein [Actinomycetota bacterium]